MYIIRVSEARPSLWDLCVLTCYDFQSTQDFTDPLHCVLDAYQAIGDQIPICTSFQHLFTSKPHTKDILVTLYKDILEFHRMTIGHFKQRSKQSLSRDAKHCPADRDSDWQTLFKTSWKDFGLRIDYISDNVKRHRTLLENGASIADFETMQQSRQTATMSLEREIKHREMSRRDTIRTWLCPSDCESHQRAHRQTRSICPDPGRWLLNNSQFKAWLDPEFCSVPLLWLNGIPGAGKAFVKSKFHTLNKITGKTILASIVVDEARCVLNSSVAFFYCKHGDKMRSSFTALARSILAQVLLQNDHLLPYFFDMACTNGDTVLSSAHIAEQMLGAALGACERIYLVIDGLDECGSVERKRISTQFRTIVDTLPPAAMGSIRCFFISQDDGPAQKTLADLPTIKMTSENEIDLTNFAAVRHERIEEKFGELRSTGHHIANIISARAQGA